MSRRVLATLAACLFTSLTGRSEPLPPPPSAARLPVSFEPNRGQFDPTVRFVSRGRGYQLFLTDTEAVLRLTQPRGEAADAGVIRLSFDGSHPQLPAGEAPQPGTVNYLIGNDPAKWRTGITTFERVRYDALYPGIDLLYYGNGSRHEYDLVVAPGADPDQIALKITGADRVALDASGQLQLTARESTVTMRAPQVYQVVNGERRDIGARYSLARGNAVRFELDSYDRDRAVVIDPEIVYGTFLGGSGDGIDQLRGVAVDGAGSPYVVGFTEASDYTTDRPLQPSLRGSADAVITKLTPDGLQRVYSTYLGGAGYETADAIAVRNDGVAYILGSTTSTDFPVRGDAFQRQNRGNGDVFIAELSANGSSIGNATLIGGGDIDTPGGIALGRRADPVEGSSEGPLGDRLFVYGSTTSPNFPTLRTDRTARTGDRDGFVTVLDRQTMRPVYSTYAGTAGNNLADGLQLDRTTGEMHLLLQRTDDDGALLARFQPTFGAQPADDTGSQTVVQGWMFLETGLHARLNPYNFASPAAIRQLLKGAYLLSCHDDEAGVEQLRQVCTRITNRAPSRTNRADTIDRAAADEDTTRTAFVLAMPGCLPVAPATTCGERAVLMFFDGNTDVLGYLNIGGQRSSAREFTITGSAVDERNGRLHLIGRTADSTLPVVNPVQGSNRGSTEGFVLTLDADTRAATFFSYLGGAGADELTGIAVDKDGNRWIVGSTQSSDFPVTRSGVQPERRGRIDGFVVKITP